MVDVPWLFPELAKPLVQAHDNFFMEMAPPGVPLTQKELQSYESESDSFLAGWRFTIETSAGIMNLSVLFDAETPFSAPRVALSDQNFFLKWPHVEKDGILCLRHLESQSL